MSYFRLDAEDLVVSADAAVQPLWSSGNITQTDFFTSTTQANSTQGNYYLSIYNGDPATNTTASVQFDITFGDLNGSGSAAYNPLVVGASPTRTIYGQYRNLIFGDENTQFTFSVNGASAVTSSNFWVINFNRTNYKEHLFPASLNLTLQSGSSNPIVLTDNSKDVTINSFCDAGRIYDIVSGTDGSAITTGIGTSSPGFTMSGSYGYFLPDIDTIILNPLAIGLSGSAGGIGIGGNDTPDLTNSNPSPNFNRLFHYIATGSSFQIQSEETITSDYVFCRVRNSEANYSINPSFISSSTGEILDDVLINSPEVYATAVGLYNDSNELLAVAKLSRPLRKDFTKEALVRVKLDF